MSRLILWVIGPTGSGKTTFVDRLGAVGVPTLSVGREIRGWYSSEKMLKAKSAYRFEDLDDMVCDMVKLFLDKTFEKPIVAIDGFPRGSNQIEMVLSMLRESRNGHLIVQMICNPLEVRIKRLILRDSRGCTELTDFNKKRIEDELEPLASDMNHILSEVQHYSGISLVTVDNSISHSLGRDFDD